MRSPATSKLLATNSCATTTLMSTCVLCRRSVHMASADSTNAAHHFLQSVPYALKNLRWLLHHAEVPVALPTLMDAFKNMLASEKLLGLAGPGRRADRPQFSVSRFTKACRKTSRGTAEDLFSTGGAYPIPDGKSASRG